MRPGTLGSVAFALAAVSVLAYVALGTSRAAGPAPDSMTVDMDITGNTASGLPVGHTEVLGTVESCVVAAAGSNVTFDVTVQNIPASNPMIAFFFLLNYDPAHLSVTAAGTGFFLAANAGSSMLVAGDETLLPDSDGALSAAVVDISASTAARESGSGVLERLTVAVAGDAPDGLYDLTLDGTQSGVEDPPSQLWPPDAVFNGQIALGVACPTPTPTPNPCDTNCTPTPPVDVTVWSFLNDTGQTASDLHAHYNWPFSARLVENAPGCPQPSLSQAYDTFDLDWGVPCVDTGESVKVEITSEPPATNRCFYWTLSGEPLTSPGGDGCQWSGDTDCDGGVDSVDALKNLRNLAGLPINLPQGCEFHGDIDCNGQVTGVDSLHILRHVAQLPSTLPPYCPLVGSELRP